MPLKDTHYIVTAGGTIEPVDPVRYISNHSSGKMGIEIAKRLYELGADVLLVRVTSPKKSLPISVPKKFSRPPKCLRLSNLTWRITTDFIWRPRPQTSG
jgi:hypothetical protein